MIIFLLLPLRIRIRSKCSWGKGCVCKEDGADMELEKKVNFKKVTPDAMLPTKATTLAAGFDFYSIDNYFIPPWSNCLVDTGIAVKNVPSMHF